MNHNRIKNFDAIASTDSRAVALKIIEAGLDAIDTEKAVRASVVLEGERLKIKDRVFDLSDYKKIAVIGFGKVACRAVATLEEILGNRITDGIVIDTNEMRHKHVRMFVGTHPMPSKDNVAASKEIVDLAESLDENDLAVVIVSGGGSALLCWPNEECEQGQKLYKDFVKTSGTIKELNTVRKHLSSIKGGGLAKLLYPATTVGLIFSDVPGDVYEEIASEPTYLHTSTSADAQAVLDAYKLTGYTLQDTPKDKKFFAKVTNIPLVSNTDALRRMNEKGAELGLAVTILSSSSYESPTRVADMMFSASTEKSLVLIGGELKLKVPQNAGIGGRNETLALHALLRIIPGEIFIALASDGRDNNDAAGAIVDSATAERAKTLGLDPKEYLERFDAFTFFEKVGDLILTGPTNSNVSDLALLLRI